MRGDGRSCRTLPACLRFGQIAGQREMNRTGALAGGHADGLVHGHRRRAGLDPQAPFCDWPVKGNRVQHLVGSQIVAGGRNLSGKSQQRVTVHPGIGDAGGHVGCTRTDRRDTDAGDAQNFSRHAGGKRSGVLVLGQQKGDLGLPERIHELDHFPAGEPENVRNACLAQFFGHRLHYGAHLSRCPGAHIVAVSPALSSNA